MITYNSRVIVEFSSFVIRYEREETAQKPQPVGKPYQYFRSDLLKKSLHNLLTGPAYITFFVLHVPPSKSLRSKPH